MGNSQHQDAGTGSGIARHQRTSNADGITRRRDPRYIETSADLSDWIHVRVVRQFGMHFEASGLLIDLTPSAVKVGFPEAVVPENAFAVGVRMLITFRFRNLVSLTSTVTIRRIDALPNGISLICHFDILRAAEGDAIRRICEASRHGPPAETIRS